MKRLHYLAPELIAERMAEELAAAQGQNCPKRYAFVEMLKARDDSDFRRNSQPWKFYDAVIKRMIHEWPELG